MNRKKLMKDIVHVCRSASFNRWQLDRVIDSFQGNIQLKKDIKGFRVWFTDDNGNEISCALQERNGNIHYEIKDYRKVTYTGECVVHVDEAKNFFYGTMIKF